MPQTTKSDIAPIPVSPDETSRSLPAADADHLEEVEPDHADADPILTIEPPKRLSVPPPLPRSARANAKKPATGYTADDTHQQDALQAENLIRRRASGPRRRLTLTSDSIRDAIELRYREEGQWEALVELYLNRIEVAQDPTEKTELLKRIADVFARELDDPDQAFDALIEAFDLTPNDDETVAALEEVARRSGDWTKLVDAVRTKLAIEDDEKRELRFAELLVRWHRVELEDPAAAEPFLARVRKIDPSHPLVHRRLASVYREVGVWDAQRDALERALLSAKTDADRCAIHVALGELYEQRAKNGAKAIEHFDAALGCDASCMPALRGLERICRMREDLVSLARVLDRQIDATHDDDERVGALMRLAEIHERHFVKPQQAAPKLETVLDLAPSHQGAFDALVRCYHAMRAWSLLARTLERRALVSESPLERTDIIMRVAEVHESKLGDVDAALAAYRRVYDLDSGHRQALVELARLSEKAKRDFTAAAAYRSRLAELTDAPKARAQIHASIADMLVEGDRDLASARLHYQRAVEMDPTHASAWEGMQALAQRTGDALYAVYCLEQRAEHTESARAKAQLLVELARLKSALGDERGSFATFDYAWRTDASNEPAAKAVFDEYVKAERWAEASAVCELLIASATREGNAARIFALLRRASTIARAVGNGERALLAALAAFDMHPDDADARDALIDACHTMRDDEPIRARTRSVLAKIAGDARELSPPALVQLAEIRRADGDETATLELLCHVLTLDAENARALAILGEIFAARGDWKRACNCKQRLALAILDATKRQAAILETAELWEKRANDRSKAARLLEKANELAPGDAVVLHKLVGIYNALQKWEKLVAALEALAEIETDVVRKAKTLYAMAGIVREKIDGTRRAARIYDEVLELDESRLDAFEHVVRIYTELREWNDLRAAYAKMLARVHDQGDPKLKHALYYQLGLVYRDRLGDAPRALDAFRCASQLKPDDDEDRKIVIELLVVMNQVDIAVATARAAVKRDPLRTEPYRELYELFLRQGTNDKAWCAVSALAHLGETGPDETRFFHGYPPCDLTDIPGTLASSAWRSHILHPQLDQRMCAILDVVTPAILRMRFDAIPEAQRDAWLGPRLDVKQSRSDCGARVVALIENACEVLGMPMPDLYERPAMTTPFAVAPTPRPALFVSLEAAEALPSDLLPYLIARRIGELRPDLGAHALFPTVGELRGLLKAVMRIAIATDPSQGLKPDEAALARAMQPHEMDALRSAVSAVIGDADRVDIKRWLELADASLARVGLLIAGDFDTAWRAMQREARAPGDMTVADWRREMLTFAVSDLHADLRGAIGISLDE